MFSEFPWQKAAQQQIRRLHLGAAANADDIIHVDESPIDAHIIHADASPIDADIIHADESPTDVAMLEKNEHLAHLAAFKSTFSTFPTVKRDLNVTWTKQIIRNFL